MRYLVDTNVVSQARKRWTRRDPAVSQWLTSQAVEDLAISVVTVSELNAWVELVARKDPRQGVLLRNWLFDRILAGAQGRVLPIKAEEALLAGRLHVPDPRDYRDAFIAATALVHDLIVVTRNIRDFVPMGVRVLNPFEL
jgi:predicted nucleic acid-binding protein